MSSPIVSGLDSLLRHLQAFDIVASTFLLEVINAQTIRFIALELQPARGLHEYGAIGDLSTPAANDEVSP